MEINVNKLNFSKVGHSYLKYANPMSESKIQEAMNIMSEYGPTNIIDIGAGNGYILDKYTKGRACSATAIELPSIFNLEKYNHIKLIEDDAKNFINNYTGPSFDGAICIGSTHALGGYESCLLQLKKILKPGSMVIIGDAIWKCKPDSEYILQSGIPEDSLIYHHDVLQMMERLNLTPLWARTASLDEWDHYEWSYSKAIEDFVSKNPHHPQAKEFHSKIKGWRNLVWKWGRNTMGFGLYLAKIK